MFALFTFPVSHLTITNTISLPYLCCFSELNIADSEQIYESRQHFHKVYPNGTTISKRTNRNEYKETKVNHEHYIIV